MYTHTILILAVMAVKCDCDTTGTNPCYTPPVTPDPDAHSFWRISDTNMTLHGPTGVGKDQGGHIWWISQDDPSWRKIWTVEKYRSTISVGYDSALNVSVLTIELNGSLYDNAGIKWTEFEYETSVTENLGVDNGLQISVIPESAMKPVTAVDNKPLELNCTIPRGFREGTDTVTWRQDNFDTDNLIATYNNSHGAVDPYTVETRWRDAGIGGMYYNTTSTLSLRLRITQHRDYGYIFCAINCDILPVYKITTIYVPPKARIDGHPNTNQITCTAEPGYPIHFNMDFTHSVLNTIVRRKHRNNLTNKTTLTLEYSTAYESSGTYTCSSIIINSNSSSQLSNADKREIAAPPYIVEASSLTNTSAHVETAYITVYSFKSINTTWVYYEKVSGSTNPCASTNPCDKLYTSTDVTRYQNRMTSYMPLPFYGKNVTVEVMNVSLQLSRINPNPGGYFTFTAKNGGGTVQRNITYDRKTYTITTTISDKITEIGETTTPSVKHSINTPPTPPIPAYIWAVVAVLSLALCATALYMVAVHIRRRRRSEQITRTQQDSMKAIIAKRNHTAIGGATNMEYFLPSSDHDYSELHSIIDAYEVPVNDDILPYVNVVVNDESCVDPIDAAPRTKAHSNYKEDWEPLYAKTKKRNMDKPYENISGVDSFGDDGRLAITDSMLGGGLAADRGIPDGGAVMTDGGAMTHDEENIVETTV